MGRFRDRKPNAGLRSVLHWQLTGDQRKGVNDLPVTPSPEPVKPGPWGSATLSTRQITGLSVGVAVVLIALKAFALGASGSVSILASLADSSLDLVASLATFFAVRWAAAPADADHRYRPRQGRGHGRPGPGRTGLRLGRLHRLGGACSGCSIPIRSPAAPGRVGVVVLSIVLTGWLVWLQTRSLKAVAAPWPSRPTAPTTPPTWPPASWS